MKNKKHQKKKEEENNNGSHSMKSVTQQLVAPEKKIATICQRNANN